MISVAIYQRFQEISSIPRLPLEGNIDLTYRCNNNCRHCWLRIPPSNHEDPRELSADEIKGIVDQARRLGCRTWNISGGEPMLRPDFAEIFDYITGRSSSYGLNTNGTLITPEIARLMRRKGVKLVALYGATAEVHDHITRNQGSFQALMTGLSCLKKIGADFTVQIVPMRDNYHHLNEMKQLAQSLSSKHRIGAAWLYLSACGDKEKNEEILSQRIAPSEVIELDKPTIFNTDGQGKEDSAHSHCNSAGDDRLYASCISGRRSFHIDPYGRMTFCSFIKDPALRYDLRNGSFREAWEDFIPSLADRVRGGSEYLENCKSCVRRNLCRWCPVYGYLEHGNHSSKVEYLCEVAKENEWFHKNWSNNHRRRYHIGGLSILVESDLPITDSTFDNKFKSFESDSASGDEIIIHHHFSLPHLKSHDLGEEVYRKAPWAVYKKNHSWIYLGISPKGDKLHRVAVFNHDHSRATICSPNSEHFLKGGLHSLTLFPTDQILLASTLASREGCFIHSSGIILDGKGLLFVGHSEAGKSTMVKMTRGGRAEILCDDRMIVRRHHDGFKIYGTWSHGEVSEVSAGSAPLKAMLFLEKSAENRLIPLQDRAECRRRILACLIKPFVTSEWWNNMLDLVDRMASEIPCYVLRFDKSGQVMKILADL
jgi:radical SAM protein with 4Fe4S-binding SPASM domain